MASVLAALQARTFDGSGAWAGFAFDVGTALEWAAITGRSAEERDVAKSIKEIVDAVGNCGPRALAGVVSAIQERTAVVTGNAALFGLLAMCTKERARDIVKGATGGRCGASAWARLRARYGTASADVFTQVMRFEWTGASFRDRWRGGANGQLRWRGCLRRWPTRLWSHSLSRGVSAAAQGRSSRRCG